MPHKTGWVFQLPEAKHCTTTYCSFLHMKMHPERFATSFLGPKYYQHASIVHSKVHRKACWCAKRLRLQLSLTFGQPHHSCNDKSDIESSWSVDPTWRWNQLVGVGRNQFVAEHFVVVALRICHGSTKKKELDIETQKVETNNILENRHGIDAQCREANLAQKPWAGATQTVVLISVVSFRLMYAVFCVPDRLVSAVSIHLHFFPSCESRMHPWAMQSFRQNCMQNGKQIKALVNEKS